jgi:hypothetical protein
MDYFPHDVDAVFDEKIEALRTMFGNDGYAFYFISLERIYRSGQGELDVSNRMLMLTLANKVMVNEDKLQEMIEASADFGLFDKDEYTHRKVLTSNGIKKRSVQINGMRDKWRNNKVDVEDSFLDGKPQFSQEKTPVIHREKCIKESKGKEIESKGKQSKEEGKETEPKNQYAETVRLSFSEFQSLTNTHGHQKTIRLITELDQYKQRTGKEYTSDYHAITSWVVDRVNEQDSKPRVETVRPPLGTPKQNKHGMKVHVQEAESLTDEERKELDDMTKKLDGDK